MEQKKDMLLELQSQWERILQAFSKETNLEPGQIVVIGCSTSEVLGHRIGKGSNIEIAETLIIPLLEWAYDKRIFLAIQCCEHLNRVLVVEKECVEKYNLDPVIVLPSLNAGGALSLEAWKRFSSPVAVEQIKAHAGIDIGDTIIGMHLKSVAVPVRIEVHTLGSAHITLAKTRPKYVGGPRAAYPCS